MRIAHRLKLLAAPVVVALLFSGCATSNVTPTFPTSDTLVRPDRVLVYDFAVAPTELAAKYGLDADARGGAGPDVQTPQDIQVGRAYAKAMTGNLIEGLRGQGINAYRPNETAPAKDNTASIKGRFVRVSATDGTTVTGFGYADGEIRTIMQIFQGTEIRLSVIAEAETSTSSNLKPGPGPVPESAIEGDAKRTAAQIVERVVNYYKRRGWIN